MSRLWQVVWWLLAVVVLVSLAEQVIRQALPWLIAAGLVAGAVWLAVTIYRRGRGGW